MNLRIVPAVMLALLCLTAQAPGQSPGDADALIDQLAHPDPRQRQQAAEQLTKMGPSARAALLRASRSEDPQIAPQAAHILLQLPWHEPDDPPKVRELLKGYGQLDEMRRRYLTAVLGQLPENAGIGALMRLIEQDPSADIRWGVCELLTRSLQDADVASIIRDSDATSASAPLLVLKGRERLFEQRDEALELLRRALDEQTDRPLAGEPEPLNWAFDVLVDDALSRDDLAAAAALHRERAKRHMEWSVTEPRAVYELFALHARRGPAPGFAQDLQTFATHLSKPQTLYALSKLYQRQGRHLLATALANTAAAAGMPSQQSRTATGDFLISQGWYDLAEREYRTVLMLNGEHKPYADYTALARLSHLAGERGDELLAAEYLKDIPHALARRGRNLQPSGELAGLIEWRMFRAARNAGDAEQMKQHADRLITYESTYIDIATDLVPWLKEHGRVDEAALVFERAYQQQREQVDQNPLSAEKLNNLAWLCARCDERLEEAVDLATRALTILPEHYAYIDTAAEAHFRVGNFAKAVELEERALQLKPNDPFMLEQLARFRAGMNDQSAR